MANGLLGNIANPKRISVFDSAQGARQLLGGVGAQGLQNEITGLTGGIQQAQLSGQAPEQDSIRRLGQIAPEVKAGFAQAFGIPANEDERLIGFAQDIGVAARLAKSDPDSAYRYIVNRRNELRAFGQDTAKTDQLINEFESGNVDLAVANLDSLSQSLQETGFLPTPQERIIKQSEISKTGQVTVGTPGGGFEARDVGAFRQEPQRDVLPADLRTFEALTEGLTQEQRDRARDIELGLQPPASRRASVEEIGEKARVSTQQRQSQALAKEAFDKLPAIRKSILNIDDAISAIDKGADTGTIQARLPSIRAASIELDNLRNRMGLDVVSGSTFGALSEGELRLALSTALPTNLQPKALKAWLKRKKSAQDKVRKGLLKQARFFSKGGTIAKLLERDEREGLRPEVEKPKAQQIGRFQVEEE